MLALLRPKIRWTDGRAFRASVAIMNSTETMYLGSVHPEQAKRMCLAGHAFPSPTGNVISMICALHTPGKKRWARKTDDSKNPIFELKEYHGTTTVYKERTGDPQAWEGHWTYAYDQGVSGAFSPRDRSEFE